MTTTDVLISPVAANPAIDLSGVPCLVAGYAGRDETSVRAHIHELQEIGVAPPPRVPMFYPMSRGLLTTQPLITVSGAQTSGEVEPVFAVTSEGIFLGVGSDHTDRELETRDVLDSKLACAKPIGSTFYRISSWDEVDWDAIRIRSWVDGLLYQDGYLSQLRHPLDLLEIYRSRENGNPQTLVCFGGTVPIIGGTFQYGRSWQISLEMPGRGAITHSYTVKEK